MFRMTDTQPVRILSPEDAPAEMVNASGGAPFCIVCEHASAAIPAALGDLGLAAADRYSHAAWDPGAEALARDLSGRFDAPLVLARVSRLVHDCNRPPGAPDAIPARTERIEVPGNRNLSGDQRAARAREVYEPFHATVSEVLDRFARPPALVTIHSFAPVWHGARRETELGLLHDDDNHLARAMLAAAEPAVRTELNRPYSAADGVTHTLNLHATKRGLRSVMIEVRNDLLADAAGVTRIAALLERMLTAALSPGADAA